MNRGLGTIACRTSRDRVAGETDGPQRQPEHRSPRKSPTIANHVENAGSLGTHRAVPSIYSVRSLINCAMLAGRGPAMS